MRDLASLNINEGGDPVTRPAPTPQQVDEFERAYSLRIPEDLLRLLQHSNGGHPEASSVNDGWAIDKFFHLGDRGEESLWQAMATWRPILGPAALPFAQDGGGNVFFLDVSVSPAPVSVCVHDEDFRKIRLSNSFEELIDGLYIDPDLI